MPRHPLNPDAYERLAAKTEDLASQHMVDRARQDMSRRLDRYARGPDEYGGDPEMWASATEALLAAVFPATAAQQFAEAETLASQMKVVGEYHAAWLEWVLSGDPST